MVEVALELMGGEVKECKGEGRVKNVSFNKEKKQCWANTCKDQGWNRNATTDNKAMHREEVKHTVHMPCDVKSQWDVVSTC